MKPVAQFPFTFEAAHDRLAGNTLAIWLGFQLDELEPGRVAAHMAVDPARHIAPNGFLHAGVSLVLADIACGLGSFALLRSPDESMTTIELKSNHIGTVASGVLHCKATVRHAGSNTHVWDADVIAEATGKPIMIFRCTQMVLRLRQTSI
ncbi:MAG: PaaI family thioesterase [Deltaproteobacteria bacterium]|jgi:uncharacterized protein (TIGR00369 family)|nr:PaaI family thioesterase [Deltaproteobacteria bacterium]